MPLVASNSFQNHLAIVERALVSRSTSTILPLNSRYPSAYSRNASSGVLPLMLFTLRMASPSFWLRVTMSLTPYRFMVAPSMQ